MYSTPNEISVERLLEQDIPELAGFHKDIVMVNNFGDMSLFAHPVRLRATSVLVCLTGVIDCNVNLRNFRITENHMLVNFAGDIIQINKAENITGYAIIFSEEYLQEILLDFLFSGPELPEPAQQWADRGSEGGAGVSETILYSDEKEYGGWKLGSDQGAGTCLVAYNNIAYEAVSAASEY